MEKAYIVLAHKNPEQLCRLLSRLDDGCSVFFIHIDRKTDIAEFSGLMQFGLKARLVERLKADWGSFGLVDATLNCMRAIRDSNETFDRIILLSGQDYPIKNNETINHHFDSSPYSVFMEYVRIPDHDRWQPRGGLYRVDKYFLGFRLHQRLLAKTLNLVSGFLPFVRRRLPQNMVPYGGSQWWIIDAYTLNYILDFVEKHPEYIQFHKSTFAPDELFFHSILLNADDVQIKKRIINDNRRYISWKDPAAGHPELLRKADFQEIIQSNALFARKLDPHTDEDLFDLIDIHCLRTDLSGR